MRRTALALLVILSIFMAGCENAKTISKIDTVIPAQKVIAENNVTVSKESHLAQRIRDEINIDANKAVWLDLYTRAAITIRDIDYKIDVTSITENQCNINISNLFATTLSKGAGKTTNRGFDIELADIDPDANNCKILIREQPSQKDCGTDLDCFIEAARTCKQAVVTPTTEVDFFGFHQTSTDRLELLGLTDGLCKYSQKRKSIEVEFSNELKEQMSSQGSTGEEIEQAEEDANKSAQEEIGIETTCEFTIDSLVDVLIKWKEGDFNSEDWESCQASQKN